VVFPAQEWDVPPLTWGVILRSMTPPRAAPLLAALLLLLAIAALAFAALVLRKQDEAPRGLQEFTPAPAAAFADSVGVNVHMSYAESAYADPRIAERVREVGVRHVRDGLELGRPDQWARLLELARVGARSTLILGDPREGDIPALLATLRNDVRPAVEAVEGPNEYDASGDPRWAEALRRYQRELAASLERDPALRGLPLLGPSFVERDSRMELGDLSGALDLGNLHPYPGGSAPESGLPSEVGLARVVAAAKPLVATETGYHNALEATYGQPPVTEEVAADYLPRLYFSHFAAGIRRTFWYELVDEYTNPERDDAEQHFGLLRRDLSRKPAFSALANLNRIVRDQGEAEAQLEPLAMRVTAEEEVRRVLLQRRDGTYLLALWRPVELERVPENGSADVRAVPVSVELTGPPERARIYRPSRSARPQPMRTGDGSLRLRLDGELAILELQP
jgi:hypothetical protein